MDITYKIDNNPIDRKVRLFDEVFVENNKDLLSVSVNGVAVTPANKVAPISISGSTATPTGGVNDPAIIVNTDANGAVTLGIGYIDCGTYDDPQP